MNQQHLNLFKKWATKGRFSKHLVSLTIIPQFAGS